ncbi:general secretion pathway protein GspB [uncultured Salinisphaera sp.]|uniref:general secretion pathway protein GspB n=1 Tax=uncultured Salinisphaera sp. TaxID=359372 RepID=UPI0032B1E092
MSYLVDALKKAERERHENQRADLRSLAGGGPASGHGGSALRWLVGLLIACNAALLIYLFLPSALSSAVTGSAARVENTGASAPAVAVDKNEPVANADRARPQASVSTSAPDSTSDPTPTPTRSPDPAPAPAVTTQSAPNTPVQDTSSSPTLPPADPRPADDRFDGSAQALAGENGSARRGQVTYSATPLDDASDYVEDESRAAPVSDTAPPGAPDVSINGHLYSSVPGRSFILVGGQRYHEGERLVAGPAVESIDAGGATLNYRGQRYHVRGPG